MVYKANYFYTLFGYQNIIFQVYFIHVLYCIVVEA